jgi:S1/P1 Nuclease
MSTRNLVLLTSALALSPVAHAWGTLGHDTVALIAQHYVTSATKSWAQKLLGSTSSTYLADVATWADSYRYTSAGSFSAPYHYIDAEDNPPSSCNVEYSRDCGSKGCSISAMANYVRLSSK